MITTRCRIFAARRAAVRRLGWIPVETLHAGRQRDPQMPSAVVDGYLRRRKRWVREGTDRDAYRILPALFRMEEGSSADRTEAKGEARALVADARVLGGRAEDLVGRGETGQRGEHAAGSLLAREAMTESDTPRLAVHQDAQLAA